MLDLVCGTCGQPIQMPERAIGHRARCRGCGMEFIVPTLAVGGPRVVKPIGEPEMNWSQEAAAPPADEPAAAETDPNAPAIDLHGTIPLRPLAPPPRTPVTVRTPDPVQEQLDSQFLDHLEAERRRHIKTGQYTTHPRPGKRASGTQMTLAVIGGIMGFAAIVVFVTFLFRACNYQEQLLKEVPPPPVGQPSGTPTPQPPGLPAQTPRPAQPATPATPDQPEPMLSVLGRPSYRENADFNFALIKGDINNRYAQPVEEAVVTVTLRTDDGQVYGRAGTTVKMIPPDSTAPFTIRIDDVQGGRAAEPRPEDYTVTGRPNGEDDWVELRVLTPPRVDQDVMKLEGEVENNTPYRVAHIRVMCDLYAGGQIILQKEARMRDTNVILRPRGRDSYILQWTDAETGEELLDFDMTARAMARRLSD